MENKKDLDRLSDIKKFETILQERTPKALWMLFKKLNSGDIDSCRKVLNFGYNVNLILKLDSENIPEDMLLYGEEEEWGKLYPEITLLGISSFLNDENAIFWLCQNGAYLDVKFLEGRDLLWLSMKNSNVKIFEFLYDNGAPLYCQLNDLDGFDRLIHAVRLGSVESVLWLKSKCYDFKESDNFGRTALHHNLMKEPYEDKDERILEILLEEGLSPNSKDNFDMPAHGYFSGSPDLSAKELLSKHNVKRLNSVSFEATRNLQAHIKKTQEEESLKQSKILAPKTRIQLLSRFRPKVMGK